MRCGRVEIAAEESAATFVRIGFGAVGADFIGQVLAESENRYVAHKVAHKTSTLIASLSNFVFRTLLLLLHFFCVTSFASLLLLHFFCFTSFAHFLYFAFLQFRR